MGEIFEAYVVLNKTLGLGLSEQEMFRAEANFKSLMVDRVNFPKAWRANQGRLVQNFEFKGMLVPRAKPLNQASLAKLGKVATQKITNDLRKLRITPAAPSRGTGRVRPRVTTRATSRLTPRRPTRRPGR